MLFRLLCFIKNVHTWDLFLRNKIDLGLIDSISTAIRNSCHSIISVYSSSLEISTSFSVLSSRCHDNHIPAVALARVQCNPHVIMHKTMLISTG